VQERQESAEKEVATPRPKTAYREKLMPKLFLLLIVAGLLAVIVAFSAYVISP
jgi:hypothetical protein